MRVQAGKRPVYQRLSLGSKSQRSAAGPGSETSPPLATSGHRRADRVRSVAFDFDSTHSHFILRAMSKIIGIDLGTTNSVVAVMEGDQPTVIQNAEGQPADAVGRRVQQDRRAAGRPGRQAPGGHQSREHHLLHQALHGPPLRRSQRGNEDGAVRSRRAPRTATCASRPAARNCAPPQISAMILQKLKQAAEDYLGPAGDQGRDHRAGLLQRRAAAGDQGSRQHRRPRGDAHRQRADRRGAGLRARQEEGRDHRRLRLRRRHLRHLDPRSRRGRGRGEVDQRRHAPRRRQPRSAHHRVDHRASSRRATASIWQGPHGAAASARGGGEGQDGAVVGDGDARSTCRSSPPTPAGRSTWR